MNPFVGRIGESDWFFASFVNSPLFKEYSTWFNLFAVLGLLGIVWFLMRFTSHE